MTYSGSIKGVVNYILRFVVVATFMLKMLIKMFYEKKTKYGVKPLQHTAMCFGGSVNPADIKETNFKLCASKPVEHKQQI